MDKIVDTEAIHTKRLCVRYWPDLTFMAKQNRKNPTEAEKKMWNEYLSRDKTNYRFLRQKPIHRFILDFYCSKLNLAIEIDGDSHRKKKWTDEERDKFLYQIGINTIRFTNEQVLYNPDYVKSILNPFLSKRGRGDFKKNPRACFLEEPPRDLICTISIYYNHVNSNQLICILPAGRQAKNFPIQDHQ